MDSEDVGPSWGQWSLGQVCLWRVGLVPFHSLSSLLFLSCHEVGEQLCLSMLSNRTVCLTQGATGPSVHRLQPPKLSHKKTSHLLSFLFYVFFHSDKKWLKQVPSGGRYSQCGLRKGTNVCWVPSTHGWEAPCIYYDIWLLKRWGQKAPRKWMKYVHVLLRIWLR